MIIAVFGSARVTPVDAAYEMAYAIGRSLAENGDTVITGGYGGVMEAASKGASEAGGAVVGVTLTPGSMGQARERVVNAWVQENITYDTMRQRLHHLVDVPDGYVALPGGIGTLEEVVEMITW